LFWRQVVASKTEDGESAEDFLKEQTELFAKGFSFSGYERDMFAFNLGDGRFADVSGVSGIDSVGDGRGAVFADFDDDGDTDVFLRSMHGPAHLLFRNELGADSGNWLRVALRGRQSGTDAFGATVRVRVGDKVQAKVVDGGSGFLSQADRRLLFGIGEAERVDSIEVSWPSGLRQRLPGAAAGQSLLITEGVETVERVAETPARLGGEPSDARWPSLPGVSVGAALADLGLGGTPVGEIIAKPGDGPVLVSFFASWCGSCRRELPTLQRLTAEAGVTVVGVSVDGEDTAPNAPAFVEKLGLDYPWALADHAQAQALFGEKVTLPAVVLLDGKRRVQDAAIGGSTQGLARLVEAASGKE
jgi:thiol-disulfide isomerase/thioredoxin